MKFLLSVVFSAVFFTATNAQTAYTISGTVINITNGLPMQSTSVFAQNTTIGTVTDNDGKFTINLPAGGFDLVFSFTGFNTETKRVSAAEANEKLEIKMKEKEKELEAVSVVSTNEVMNGMEKYGSFFKEEFIGKTENAKNCTIENPEVLHFFYSKRKNRLKITATDQLIIKNNALGYVLKYALDSFTHEYKTEVSTFTGFPFYENIIGDSIQTQNWKQARELAYKGSSLHFMRSLYNKNLKEEKFDVQFVVNVMGKEEAIKLKDIYTAMDYSKDDSTQTVEILPNQPNVGILYMAAKPNTAYLAENKNEPKNFRFSILAFKPNEPLVIEQNGYCYDQNDIAISGYWSWEKIADQLPYDYKAIN
jgi:CarboxypepD_reg-like domain